MYKKRATAFPLSPVRLFEIDVCIGYPCQGQCYQLRNGNPKRIQLPSKGNVINLSTKTRNEVVGNILGTQTLKLTTLAQKGGVLSFWGCLGHMYAKYYMICIICSFFRKGKLYRTLHNHPQNTTFFQKHHILPMSSEKSLNLLQEFINSRAACGDNQNYSLFSILFSLFFTAAKPPIFTLHSSLSTLHSPLNNIL